MKAFALTAADQPAALVDLPVPEVAPVAPGSASTPRASTASTCSRPAAPSPAMMPHELPTVVGRDFAGVVDAVGEGRTDVAVGDEVLGLHHLHPAAPRGRLRRAT